MVEEEGEIHSHVTPAAGSLFSVSQSLVRGMRKTGISTSLMATLSCKYKMYKDHENSHDVRDVVSQSKHVLMSIFTAGQPVLMCITFGSLPLHLLYFANRNTAFDR